MRQMVMVLVLSLMLASAVVATADESRAVPPTVWYQGFLADVDTGEPITGTVDIIARLYTVPVSGTVLWGPESHVGVTVTEGWFNIELGSIEPLPNFYGTDYYLDLRVDGEVLSSRMKLGSVPAALHSASADTSFTGGGGGSSLWQELGGDVYRLTGDVGIGTSTPARPLHVKRDQDSMTTIAIENTDTGANSVERLSFINEDGSLTYIAAYDDDSAMYPARLAIANNRPGGTIWLKAANGQIYIDTNGYVGVGTTTPTTNLDVNGAARVDGFVMPTGAVNGHILTSDATGIATWQAPAAADDGDWTVSGNHIYPTAADTLAMGTTAPDALVHIETGGSEDFIFESTGSSGSVEFIGLTSSGGVYDDLKLSKHGPTASGSTAGIALAGLGRLSSGNMAAGLMLQAKGDTPMYFAAGDTVRMRIDSEGTVNILDVLHLEPTLTIPTSPANGDMIVYGSVGSQGLYIYINDFWELLVGSVKEGEDPNGL